MTSEIEHVPAPTEDELQEFESLALAAPVLPASENAGALHNQFRLVVPRLIKEIRRLRDLDQLQREREQLHDEKRKREVVPPARHFTEYEDGIRRLRGGALAPTSDDDEGMH